MTAFQNIVEAIKGFGYPYEPDLYTGTDKKYFTYNYADDRGDLYGDNEPGTIIASVQVHFFLPIGENFIREKNKIRKALFQQGFTYPEATIETEKENEIRHIIFECDIEEMEE